MGVVLAKQIDRSRERFRDSFDDNEEHKSEAYDLKGISARVDKVSFDGVNRTKTPVLQHYVQPLFKAQNFEQVLASSEEVRHKLSSLGIFKAINIQIDVSEGVDATPNGYEVTFLVDEMKKIKGNISTFVANNEAFLVIGGAAPNIFGTAESARGEFTYGSSKNNTMTLSFAKPFFTKFDPVGTTSLFIQDSEWPMSGYKLKDYGLLLDMAVGEKSNVKQNFQYELNWKNISACNKYASFAVRQDAGHKLKSALRHIMTLDRRDDHLFPSAGYLLRNNMEYAGLGGNIRFLKHQIDAQWNLPIWSKDFVFQISSSCGHTVKWDDHMYTVADNFFLGGPLDLRGFQTRSVGNKKDENFVGGTTFYALALHLFTPLPFRPGQGGFGDLFRSHIWLNLGNCGDVLPANWKGLKETIRISAGVGVALRLGGIARIELNFCHPIKAKETDVKCDGVQFGIGVHFL